MSKPTQAIFVGASAGGISAILKLLDILPKDFPIPIIVAQHLPKDLQVQTTLVFERDRKNRVFEAEDKMPIQAGHVYFAPPDYHLLIEPDFVLSLSQDDHVNFSRPSIDVLFESAAIAFGKGACGVLLTGSNEDGAKGLVEIKRLGGKIIVQDPEDAEFSSMPQAALDLIKPDFVGKIPDIANELIKQIEAAR